MPHLYSFAGYELDPTARTLCCAGALHQLGGRAFDVLLALIEEAGSLVTKDQLLQRAWPGLVVEEANVAVQISALRKLLGPRAIATVAGVGYRLALPVQSIRTPTTRNNLPGTRTRFIGREAILPSAAQRLDQTRLLTLIGIGGTGKTRLALQLANRVLPMWPDGIWWLDLSPLDSVAALAQSLAQSIGLRLQSDRPALDSVVTFLRHRRVLLVLDNAEHMLDAASAAVDTLLAGTTAAAVLLTSREALGLPGECILQVPPMRLPPTGAALAELDDAEAVRLFVDRAAEGQPGFAMDDTNRAVVMEICRRVDGIPLALELAAAQLHVVSPAQLRVLLEDQFRSWTGHRRALPRQQTLQAVIGWSFDRLHTDEQLLLRAVSVCSAGCALDAAQALVVDALPAPALLAALRRLVDCALIQTEHRQSAGAGVAESTADPPRFRVLDTVRQFALDSLRDAPARDILDERHARHYLAMAEAHDDEVVRQGRGNATLNRLQQEHDNLLQAFAWCQSPALAAVEVGLRLAAAMRHYWTARGSMVQGLQLTLQALDRAAGRAPDKAHWWALCSATQLSRWTGLAEEAARLSLSMRSMARQLGDPDFEAMALIQCSVAARADGRDGEAVELLEAACRIAEARGDQKLLADGLGQLATLAYEKQDRLQAADLYQRVLVIRRSINHGYHLATALLNTAVSSMELGRTEQAAALLREAAALLPEIGSNLLNVYLLEITASYAHLRSDWASVSRLLAASGRWRSQWGVPLAVRAQAERMDLLAGAQAALGDECFACEMSGGAAMTPQETFQRAAQALT